MFVGPSSTSMLGSKHLLQPTGYAQSLIQVSDDVLMMFQSDAQPDRFDAYACSPLFVGGHLPMGR